MSQTLPVSTNGSTNGAHGTNGSGSFSEEQKQYLEGVFAGVRVKGQAFSDAEAKASPEEDDFDDLTKEEKIKKTNDPLSSFGSLLKDARGNTPPEGPNVFLYKWNGLFYLNPVKDGYMCRMRIPGGQVTSTQAREVARAAGELSTGYIQITTRNNFQVRVFEPEACPEFLRRIQSVGLHSKGAGADNIRNITANPTAGIDPHELTDVTPIMNELAALIINTREFYDLPRKFNIAFDGGGIIGAVEDTNDIGARACIVQDNSEGIEKGIYYRIKLGGVTGHKTFAKDWGVLVPEAALNDVITAILKVFVENGNRGNRNKARLKYLLEGWGFEKFREECEKVLGYSMVQCAEDAAYLDYGNLPEVAHSHVGVYPQKQAGLCYVGAHVPVGQMNPAQLEAVAGLTEKYGSGKLRLTVWQNFLITDVPEEKAKDLCAELVALGFPVAQSNLSSGMVACTGNRYCKYAASDTKGHAVEVMKFLDEEVTLDQPVNIHFTGCPHSCAQHYIGDIGLLGAKVKNGEKSVEGYHIFVGGGFAGNRMIGRQLYQGVAFEEIKLRLKSMLEGYLSKREGSETFQAFCNRHDEEALKTIFRKL